MSEVTITCEHVMKPLDILVAFETSRVMSSAFERRGHHVTSVDLLPCDEPEHADKHIQGDALEAIDSRDWDLIIAHPECTKVCVSGNHVYAEGKPRHAERLAAVRHIEKTWLLMKKRARHAALENPVGVLRTYSDAFPKPHYIQPYDHGEDASKLTGLYLHELPPVLPTRRVHGRRVRGVERWANQTDSGQNRLGPSETRWKERSRTYPGVADACAELWCAHILEMQG